MLPVLNQNKALRRWELALLLGLSVVILMGLWLSREQFILADKVVRLHVIANSDTPEDQALKLQVRDRILEETEFLLTAEGDLDEARASIVTHLDALTAAATETVRSAGYDYTVTADLENTWFPTKQYTDFALPAGNYTALRVVIGDGDGQNWWCVVFPPLCLSSVTETVEQTAYSGGLTEADISLITGETEGYIIKFKAIELWEEFKKAVS